MQSTGYDIDIRENDSTLCYDDVGESEVPIVFIHGFPFDKSMWKPQIEFLKQTYRVIAYDIRGYGRSTNGLENVSINLFADDLIKFMDNLQIPKAAICGLSMGGYIALNAVNRYATRFDKLVLSDTQCTADTSEQKEKRYETIRKIESAGLTDFAETFIKGAFCDESLANKKETVERIKKVILHNPKQTVEQGLIAMAERWETCSALNEISIPTLILCGREDQLTPLAKSESMNHQIKNSRFLIIEHAGHLSNLEQPDVFNTHLQDFLSGVELEESLNEM